MVTDKIFITGGHYTPARAVIDELSKSGQWEIFFVGRKYSQEGQAALSLEYQELSTSCLVHFLTITTGRLQRKFFVNVGQSILALSKVLVGFTQSGYWLVRYRPRIILSFGGYVALPVVILAKIMGIKIVTHEQTVVSGRANKLIAQFADKVLLSWPESQVNFSSKKAVVVGNPVRQSIVVAKKSGKFTRRNIMETVYITGGNQGSHVINVAVAQVLSELLKKYTVIHQTGDNSLGDFENLTALCQKLPPELSQKYHLHKFISTEKIAEVFSKADLVVTRSGANIVTELAVAEIPSILIPIPWVVNNEQQKNAQILEKTGLGHILPQDKLTGKTLLEAIDETAKNYPRFSRRTNLADRSLLAASRIVEELSVVIND